jgi:hypothetical protein
MGEGKAQDNESKIRLIFCACLYFFSQTKSGTGCIFVISSACLNIPILPLYYDKGAFICELKVFVTFLTEGGGQIDYIK